MMLKTKEHPNAKKHPNEVLRKRITVLTMHNPPLSLEDFRLVLSALRYRLVEDVKVIFSVSALFCTFLTVFSCLQ